MLKTSLWLTFFIHTLTFLAEQQEKHRARLICLYSGAICCWRGD